MNQLIRILNDGDRETLAWLRKHVGDVRVAAAARHLGGTVSHTCPQCAAISAYVHQRLISQAGRLKTARSATTILPRSASCWHTETKRCRSINLDASSCRESSGR
jgi:hypothetical protein